MQPFGLLNFLKLALQPSDPKNPPSATATAEETTEENATNTPSQAPPSPAQDAYHAFVDKHERTAKKIRKK